MNAITILTKVASKAVSAAAYSIIGIDVVKANFNSKENAIKATQKIATTTAAYALIGADKVKATTMQVADAVSKRKEEILAKHK